MDMSLTQDLPSTKLTAYEEQRNSRKKALHDAVERNLLVAGFTRAAALRCAFSGEAVVVEEEARSTKARRKKLPPTEGILTLRRTNRTRRQTLQNAIVAEVANSTRRQGEESFCTWPSRKVKENLKEHMAKTKTGSKRKMPTSPNVLLDTDQDERGQRSPSTQLVLQQRPNTPEERVTSNFEDHNHDLQQARREREAEGRPRPPPAGFPLEQHNRREPQQWGEQYSHAYGVSSIGASRGASTRPWSPIPYKGTRDFSGRPLEYGSGSGHYDRRLDYDSRRDPFYDRRGRDFDWRARDFQEHRRFQEGRYERPGSSSADMYTHAIEPIASSQYVRDNARPGSPPQSSSAIVENEVKLDAPTRRPLYLDKCGIPSGTMASLFRGDIWSFVKDMDSTVGWDGQTKDAKRILRDRLSHDYHFYGESLRLNEKYLKKEAGGGLIQYRYTLNQYIDKGLDKPGDLRQEYWKTLQDKRASEEGKAKSAKMATIARGRSDRHTTKRSVEQFVILRLAEKLKREPYSAEIEAEVEKEWAALQEEAVEKRKVKAAANASTMAAESLKALQDRVDTIEALIRKWEPHFEVWKTNNLSMKALDSEDNGDNDGGLGDEVPLPSTMENDNEAEGNDCDQVPDSSDDDECSEKSDSSAEENSESEDDGEDSEAEKRSSHTNHAMNVNEPEEVMVEIQSKSNNAEHATISLPKSKALTTTMVSTTPMAEKNATYTGTQQSKGKVRLSKEGTTNDKQGVLPVRISALTTEKGVAGPSDKKEISRASEAGKETESRSGKRQKLDACISTHPVVLEDANAPATGVVKTNGSPRKSMKFTQKTNRPLQGKGDKAKKRGK